ncbi:MAG: lysine--tRNA ligase [Candidatus Anstonellales archaeon]
MISTSTSLFWADKLASKTIERARREGRIPNIKCQQTPSGGKHIGNLNDVLRAYFVYKSIILSGEKCEFVHGSDDRDPLKDIPMRLMDLDGNWHLSSEFSEIRKYLGHPLCRVPDPFDCCKSWSEHFNKIWAEGIRMLDVHPIYYTADELYKKGKFDKYIELVFQKHDLVSEIIKKYQGSKETGYIPFDAICPKCGVLTNISGFDIERKTVKFTCGGKSIKNKKALGCGFSGEVPWSEGKLQWRFEWPAQWCIWHTTHEPFGKDHAEGSWKSGKEIMEKVFDAKPPIPFVYEFFLVNGEKMSASKGNVYVVQDILKLIEPEVFMFFYAKRPEKQRDLDLKEIFRLVDEFDFAEKVYFGKAEERTENRVENTKRMYELSALKLPAQCPKRINYAFAGTLAQLYSEDVAILKLRTLGHLDEQEQNERLARQRLKLARFWISTYAPPEMRIKINSPTQAKEEINKLEENVKQALFDFATSLDLPEEELHAKIRRICKERNLKIEDFFEAAYTVILSKRRGPRLVPFVKMLGEQKVRELFL